MMTGEVCYLINRQEIEEIEEEKRGLVFTYNLIIQQIYVCIYKDFLSLVYVCVSKYVKIYSQYKRSFSLSAQMQINKHTHTNPLVRRTKKVFSRQRHTHIHMSL